jgi:hypothetical protein
MEAVVETASSKHRYSGPIPFCDRKSEISAEMLSDNIETLASSVMSRKGHTISLESNRRALLAAQVKSIRIILKLLMIMFPCRPENESC